MFGVILLIFLERYTMETKKLDILCLKLCTELMKAHKSQWKNLNTPNYTVEKGRKYWKIVSTATGDSSYQGSTVWGFINVANENFKFGDVLNLQDGEHLH